MRRQARKKSNNFKWLENNKIVIGIICFSIIIFIIGGIFYNKIKNTSSLIESNKYIGEFKDNRDMIEVVESASASVGNTSEQVQEIDKNIKEEKENNIISDLKIDDNIQEKNEQTSVGEAKKEAISFIWPVSGEILKAFSMDNLLYSSTLNEWVVHNGIDIKADKTTVVVASCDGKVKAIKNDPRYGLTVIIEHEDGFRSIYSNLLTAEFVVEGETVTQGQTIGTVGNTANFEIGDDSHLHFSLQKDSEYVDPTLYLK